LFGKSRFENFEQLVTKATALFPKEAKKAKRKKSKF